MIPAGKGAVGYKSTTFHGAGIDFKLHEDIVKYVYGGDKAKALSNNMGEVLYNRGMVNAMFGVEAIRTAMNKYGNKSMTGEQVRWGLENLNVDNARLKALGMEGFTRGVKGSCADHETGGSLRIQQWNGSKWSYVSKWLSPMRDIVRPMIEKDAANFAKENNITPRSC